MPVIKIHYIGNRVYTKESFIKEAKKLGVNRALPPTVMMKLERGEKVYLAFQRGKKRKHAMIFGFFIYQSFSVNAPLEFWGEVKKDQSKYGITNLDTSQTVQVSRGCGSYTVAATFQTAGDIRETIKAMWELAREKGYKIKFFAKGTFHELPVPVYAEIPFTRGLAEYEVPDLDATPENVAASEQYCDMITHYEQVLYRKKKRRKRRRRK